MTQPPRAIYLPPGVLPPIPMPAPVQPNPNIPFDRAFFERLLPQAVQMYCQQVQCHVPRVELYTIDGTRFYVNSISGVTDTFVALQTSIEDHEDSIQVFIPYATIYRVEIHPEPDRNRGRLGFSLPAHTPTAIQERAAPAVAAADQEKQEGTGA